MSFLHGYHNSKFLGCNNLNIIVTIAIVLYVLYCICILISKLRKKKFEKYNIISPDENSITIYLGRNLQKYLTPNYPINLNERIEKFIQEYKQEKGYYFLSPNIIVSNDIKPNQVLIRDRNYIDRQVLFNVHEDFVFSFENMGDSVEFSENYPIFYNPVFFYQKDNFSSPPIEVWKNDISNFVSQTQILDLIILSYKAFALRSSISFDCEQDIFDNFDDFSSFCQKNSLLNELAGDEEFFSLVSDSFFAFISLELPIKSVEEFILFVKNVYESDVEHIYVFNEILKNQENKQYFLNSITKNEKIYAYTISSDFFNELIALEEYEEGSSEYKERSNQLLDRVIHSTKENLKFVIVCDLEERDIISSFFLSNFVFSSIVTYSDLENKVEYEVIGNIE